MHETEVAFFSEGVRLSGLLRSPAEVTAPAPAIVQGPGWLGRMNFDRWFASVELLGREVVPALRA